jgi:chromate transport protein ChrA
VSATIPDTSRPGFAQRGDQPLTALVATICSNWPPIVVGTCLGVALATSLRQQGIIDIVVPVSSLVTFLVLAGLLGLGAASWPARHAAKLDVLAAISTE